MSALPRFDFSGRRILVTGAASGIGAAAARKLAAAGVVTLTRRLFKLACRSLFKGQLPRISTPRKLRADGSGWCERTDGGLGQRNDCGLRTA